MGNAMALRVAVAAALCVSAGAALADPVKLGCSTQRAFIRNGAPSAVIATFDEQKGTAALFSGDLGGLLKGEDVSIQPETIIFNIKTKAGEPGDVTISRSTGLLMLNVKRSPEIKMLADCEPQQKRF